MKIFIFGNIGSGKTTLAKALLNNHAEFEYIAIDEFRRKFSDGSFEGEFNTQNQFIETIVQSSKNQIIECTGVGRIGERVFESVTKYNLPILCIFLKSNPDFLIERAIQKNWDTPFPVRAEKIDLTIRHLHSQLTDGDMIVKWQNLPNSTLLIQKSIDEKDKNLIIDFVSQFIKKYL